MRPRTPAARYFHEKEKGGGPKIDIKFKKTKDPAPGSYNIEDVYKKTQWKSNIHSMSKAKIKNYVDDEVKIKSFMPGVGKYKETEKGYLALSKPPTSLRRIR